MYGQKTRKLEEMHHKEHNLEQHIESLLSDEKIVKERISQLKRDEKLVRIELSRWDSQVRTTSLKSPEAKKRASIIPGQGPRLPPSFSPSANPNLHTSGTGGSGFAPEGKLNISLEQPSSADRQKIELHQIVETGGYQDKNDKKEVLYSPRSSGSGSSKLSSGSTFTSPKSLGERASPRTARIKRNNNPSGFDAYMSSLKPISKSPHKQNRSNQAALSPRTGPGGAGSTSMPALLPALSSEGLLTSKGSRNMNIHQMREEEKYLKRREGSLDSGKALSQRNKAYQGSRGQKKKSLKQGGKSARKSKPKKKLGSGSPRRDYFDLEAQGSPQTQRTSQKWLHDSDKN